MLKKSYKSKHEIVTEIFLKKEKQKIEYGRVRDNKMFKEDK